MAKFEMRMAGQKDIWYGEWHGDYMVQEGEYVKIFKRSANTSMRDEQVVAIRLEPGYSVIKEGHS